ncbi:MAG TPA: tetratricopeptide repeat protein, partial [Polyangiaceae bacterium]|nr:tetratricopeptide repeat protein [Polyangiaceae bacterium]
MKRPRPFRPSRTPLALALALALAPALGCSGSAPLAPKAVQLNRLGVEALAAGDYATAEARFAVALEFHPRFVEAQVNLGLTELARGNHGRARALFLRARSLNADLPHPHHGLGALADAERRPREAASHYREALRVDPAFVPARANLARDYFEAHMLDEAREQFLRLAEVAPHDERGPAGLAETLWRMGRPAEASEVVRAARARLGERPSLRLLAAREALAAGFVKEARAELMRLSSFRHEYATAARAWLAVADLAAGDLEAARAHAELALADDRHQPVASYALALLLEAKGDASAPAWREHVDRLTGGRAAFPSPSGGRPKP